MTHALDAMHTTPRLALLSPEPQSGKSTVLDVLGVLTAAPFPVINPSPASLFREIAVHTRTLLLDEVDAIFKPGPTAGKEDLRALLNTGYRRGAGVPRCVGPDNKVTMFPVFSPAAMAGLGTLPPSLLSRCILMRMHPRRAEQLTEQFIAVRVVDEASALAGDLGQWASDHLDEIATARPDLPPQIRDRAAECWEPLLRIAEVAGGEWPELARRACVAMASQVRSEPSDGMALLADIKAVWHQQGDADRLETRTLLQLLSGLEDPLYVGRRLHDGRELAALLKPYEVEPVKYRVGNATHRGYLKEDFEVAWARYVH